MLDDSINDADLRDAILARVGRGRLEEAISQLREQTRPVEEGHRERLLGGYGTVRRFLPLLTAPSTRPPWRSSVPPSD